MAGKIEQTSEATCAPPLDDARAADRPASEYRRRLDDRSARFQAFQRLDDRIAVMRGVAFLAGVVPLFFVPAGAAVGLAAALFSVFFALVFVHAAVLDRLNRARLAVRHYERALARLDDRWEGRGTTGSRYSTPTHLYADDLDLFGRGSLFELLCLARTRVGEDTLANWLLAPANAETVRMRQQAVEELRTRIDLRESLAVLDAEVHEDLDQNRLLQWSAETARPVIWQIRLGALVLAASSLVALAFAAMTDVGLAPFLITLLIDGAVSMSYGRRTRRLARTAERAASGLAILSQVLGLIERETFQSPLLCAITERCQTQGRPPSRQIARLERLIDYLNNSLRNQFFAPIAFVLRLPVHLVHAIERWRLEVGPRIPDWLAAVGEFEALACLSTFAYEHPDYPFPEIVESPVRFEASQLGHPILAETQCVRNDICLGEMTRLVLISGSNMSGKSTMLRTVGTNLVLAQAGAPVRARSLSTSILQIGTAMRIRDSLQSGQSLFYAAVSRLKAVLDRSSGRPPLLFLLDEILQGTNSHDRLVGSQGVLEALLDRGAIGIITTHDLALTEIVHRLGTKAVNVHFEDELVGGKMTFDYHIRPGVVQKSNALELMRLMGLDV